MKICNAVYNKQPWAVTLSWRPLAKANTIAI